MDAAIQGSVEMDLAEDTMSLSRLRGIHAVTKPDKLPEHSLDVANVKDRLGNFSQAEDVKQMKDGVEHVPSDRESDSEEDDTKKPPKVGERRKAQNLVFSSW